MLNKKHKGFTLIEILLVIVMLAALSATMMLSSKDSTHLAKANSIINTMTVIRDAALSYYTDNIENEPTPRKFYTGKVQDYLGDTAKKEQDFWNIDGVTFTVEGRTNGNVDDDSENIKLWYVKCDFSVLDSVEEAGVIKMLIEIDKDDNARLRKWNGSNCVKYNGGNQVWLKVK